MQQGKIRFDNQLNKVTSLIDESKTKENPALWLLLNDFRTPMFMLESLSKAYAQFHNKNFFTELKERFKSVEDALGAVDYYAEFLRQFHGDVKVSESVKKHLENKTNEKLLFLNDMLVNDGWINGKTVAKINEGLAIAKWQNEADEVANLEKYYYKQIKKIHEFIDETTFEFDNIEDDVHELRRKLRWLSIYPQAFGGVIKLHTENESQEKLGKYLTEEIITSKFNQLPENKELKSHLYLEKNHFLALSWMISALGTIKDTGLKITVIKDTFQEISFLKDDDALEEAYKMLGEEYPKMEDLLKEASMISKDFFKEKVLEKLVWGID